MDDDLIDGLISNFRNTNGIHQRLVAIGERDDSHAVLLPLFENIAEEVGGRVYEGYSGRGMYGKRCWGVAGSDFSEIIEVAAQHGLKGATVDSLGLDSIVYWPDMEYNGPADEDEEQND